MKVRFWGVRGSLATPGPETLKYGGNSTCVQVTLSGGEVILFDCGSGVRNAGRAMINQSGLSEIYIFLTHAHWDHLSGFPFFAPAYMEKYTLHVRGGPTAKSSLRDYLQQQMQAPYFPVPFNSLKASFDFSQGEPLIRQVGSAEVTPIKSSHPNGCYGFKITEAGRQLVFFTDHELGMSHEGGRPRQEYVEFCRGVDLLLHDTQYTEDQYARTRGWGHSTYNQGIDFAIEAGVGALGLIHHDPDHTDDIMERIENQARERARSAGLECFAAREGMTIDV
ncbi:MAG: MBL fold metallo-hydrolase [Proteobacteria bacterium]|nr:MBL fold metallo-hydrolase [Pseudomonadota bacterium]